MFFFINEQIEIKKINIPDISSTQIFHSDIYSLAEWVRSEREKRNHWISPDCTGAKLSFCTINVIFVKMGTLKLRKPTFGRFNEPELLILASIL
jgi:hypothetical protein